MIKLYVSVNLSNLTSEFLQSATFSWQTKLNHLWLKKKKREKASMIDMYRAKAKRCSVIFKQKEAECLKMLFSLIALSPALAFYLIFY